jgi:hypothetical protein
MNKTETKKFDKWSTGAYSTGYKSYGKSTYSNSSFWMDDDFLSSRDLNELDKIDYVKLAGYKRAIANFVRIVTGKDDIPVNYSSGRDSYTDGKSVVISSKLDEKEFDSTVGLALHEGSHIALTDFNTAQHRLSYHGASDISRLRNSFPNLHYTIIESQLKTLVNVIEDRRIDYFIFKSAPGYQGYYQALYEKYFNSKDIDQALLLNLKTEVTWDSYEFHIVNFANPNRQLNALPGLLKIWNMISLSTIGRLKNTNDVIDLAIEVFREIHTHLAVDKANAQTQPNQPNQSNGSGAGNESNGADVNEDVNDSQGGMDSNLDMPNMVGEQTDSNSGPEKESNSQNANGTPQLSDKEQKQAEKILRKLDAAIKKQKEFLDGKISKRKLSKSDAEKINAATEANISHQTVGDGTYEIDGVKLQGKSIKCMVVNGMSTSLFDSDLLRGHAHSTSSLGYLKRRFSSTRPDYIAEGISLGVLLGKRLKTRDEERSLKTSRLETGRIDRRLVAELGFGNDRVFAQVLHSSVTPSIVHISLDASGSMSGTKWTRAMKTAVAIAKAGTMISSLDVVISIRGSVGDSPLMWVIYDSRKDSFNAIKEKFYLVSYSGSTPEGLCYEAVMKEILASANGKEAFFINICDGEPGFSAYQSGEYCPYHGDFATAHTKKQVDKMREAGIKVLAYFIDDRPVDSTAENKSFNNFKRMYGKDSEHIDVDNLTQLSRSLNNMLERQN